MNKSLIYSMWGMDGNIRRMGQSPEVPFTPREITFRQKIMQYENLSKYLLLIYCA